MNFTGKDYDVFRGVEDFFNEEESDVLESTIESGNNISEPSYVKGTNLKQAFKQVFLRKNGTKADQAQLTTIWSSMTLNDYVMSMLNFALTENAWNKTFDASAVMLQTIFENNIAKELLNILKYIFQQDNDGFITEIKLNGKDVKYRFLQLNEFSNLGVTSTYENYDAILKQKNMFPSSYFVHLQFTDDEKNILYPLQTLYKFDHMESIPENDFEEEEEIIVNGFNKIMLEMDFLKFKKRQDNINKLFEKLDFVSFLCKDWVCGRKVDPSCNFFALQIHQQLSTRKEGMYEDITNGSKYVVLNKEVFTVKYKIPIGDEQYVYQKLYGSNDGSSSSVSNNIELYKMQFNVNIQSVGLFYDYDTIITMLSALCDVTDDNYDSNRMERMVKSVNTRLEWNIDSEENIVYHFGHISESLGRPSLKSMSAKTSHLWKNGSLLNEFHSYNLPPYHNKQESMNSQYHAYTAVTQIDINGLPRQIKKIEALKPYLKMEMGLVNPLDILDKHLYRNFQKGRSWYELDQGLLEEEGVDVETSISRKRFMQKYVFKKEQNYQQLSFGEKYLVSIGYTLQEIDEMKQANNFIEEYTDESSEAPTAKKKSKSYCNIYPPHLIDPELTLEKLLSNEDTLLELYCELEKLKKDEKESLLYFLTGFFVRHKFSNMGTDKTLRLEKKKSNNDSNVPDFRLNYCLYESFLINLKSEAAQMKKDFEEHKLKAVGQIILVKESEDIAVNSSSTTTTTTTTTRSTWKRYKIQRTIEGMFLAKSNEDGNQKPFQFNDFGKTFRGLSWSGNLQRFVDKDYWFMYEQYKNLKDYWKNCYEIFEYILRKMLLPMMLKNYKNRCGSKKKKTKLLESLLDLNEKAVKDDFYTLAIENLLLSMNYIAEEVLLEDEETSQLIQRRISSRYRIDRRSSRIMYQGGNLIQRDDELLRSRERLQTFIDKFLSIVRSFFSSTTLEMNQVDNVHFERFFALFDYAYFIIGSRVGVSFSNLTNLLGNEHSMAIIKPDKDKSNDNNNNNNGSSK